jgi:hypothetical protein
MKIVIRKVAKDELSKYHPLKKYLTGGSLTDFLY